MYKITTHGRLYLIGSMSEVLDFIASISKPGITLKEYLEEHMKL